LSAASILHDALLAIWHRVYFLVSTSFSRGRQRVLIKQKRPFKEPSCDFPQLVLNFYYYLIFKFVVRILERTFSISCSEPENFSQLATGKQVSNELRLGCLNPPCVGVWNTPTVYIQNCSSIESFKLDRYFFHPSQFSG